MKRKAFILGLMFAATGAFAQTLSSGIDLKNLDRSVRPGDDFYHFAAGGWLKSHPLDAEHSDNGAFTDLYELNQKRIQDIILKYAGSKQKQGSLEQKIGSLYNLMMDSARLNREGWSPIKPTLKRIADIKTRKEYQLVTAELDRNGEGTMMFNLGIDADLRNADWYVVSLDQGGLGLGTRDYYLSDDDQNKRVLEAYKNYLKKMFILTGNDDATAEKKMQAVLAIETRIAKVSYDRVKLRDINANYHKMSYTQLVTDFPGIDWGNMFLMSGLPAVKEVVVGQPEPLHEVEKILAETSLDDLKTYAEARVIAGASSQMSDEFRAEAFKLSSALSGTMQDRPRWKRAVSLVSGTLGEAIGKLYVEQYFPESSKKRMLELVHNLQTALGQRIDEATWMGTATKAQAKEKLANFIIKIGYPDKWKDYTGLQVNDSLSLYENLQNIARWATDDLISRRANKKVDKAEWGMTPQTVNAYYNPTTNEICFPAGILQRPFFDPKADAAFNYGAIGVVIGHEMTHGFDDQGRQYDAEGNLHDWWTASDAAGFDKRANQYADFFDAIEVLPGLHCNGRFTLGENLADHGGLQVAFNALKNYMAVKPLAVKDGFTPEQRFFIAYAGVWGQNITEKEIRNRVKRDPHALGRWRVDGALPHIEAFYEAFGVKKGDKMYIPEEERLQLW